MKHGKYRKRLKADPDVDQREANQWLRSSGLRGETEGLIIAAEDLSLAYRLMTVVLQLTLTAGSAENLKSRLITLSRGAGY